MSGSSPSRSFSRGAIEELLRAYALVTNGRPVRRRWIGTAPLKADGWILLPLPAANSDPCPDRPVEVVLDRRENGNPGRGAGSTVGVGSHLARVDLRTTVEVWLQAFPEFSLADSAAVCGSGG